MSLADIAGKPSKVLIRLCSEIKNAPELILALSNEVNDLRLVLNHLSTGAASVQAPTAPANGSAAYATATTRLQDMLTGAKFLMEELDILREISSAKVQLPNASSGSSRSPKHETQRIV
jgi:hypothetical protein